MSIHLILLIVAAVCFALAALNVNSPVNLIAAGLLAWVLSILIGAR
jgi:hypothetical protein